MIGFIDFLLKYWRLILEAIILLVSVIVLILRKKPVNVIYQDIYSLCIYAIEEVEKTELKGREKLDAALDLVAAGLRSKYPNIEVLQYLHYIENVIELILSTPQKKGE